MNKHCRIVVTDKCNLHCDYCLMKDKDINQSFKTSTIEQIIKQNYNEYLLTGGEPTCDMLKLAKTMAAITSANLDAKIYLYSNGLVPLAAYKSLSGFSTLKGINIGWHGMEMFGHYDAINSIIPIRIYALYYEVTNQLETYCRARGTELKVLQWNQCNNPNEDRYRLE